MNELLIYDWLIIASFALAAIVFIALFFITAPYGRHSRSGWGLTISDRLGWIIMESFSVLIFLYCYIVGDFKQSITALIFLVMWELHYLHRAFIFPFTLRNGHRKMTLLVVLLGLIFNTSNAYLNGRWVFTFSGGYPTDWLTDPRFVLGIIIFISGYIINRQADLTLRSLRSSNESGYKVPFGGMYRWISCPNYCGEIMIWTGWAIATWSLPGLAFAVWTTANLVPRARAHQKWYKEQFPDYPPERKILLPGIW
jgi:3-oxo-5-alpha-steroid 4-dehydrogenase 1